jgi:hypothetical protein
MKEIQAMRARSENGKLLFLSSRSHAKIFLWGMNEQRARDSKKIFRWVRKIAK